MDRGAWRATVHGVSKSGTRLSDWVNTHTHTHTHTHTRCIGVLGAIPAAPLCRGINSLPAEVTHACCPQRRATPVIPEAGSEAGIKGLPVSCHLIPREHPDEEQRPDRPRAVSKTRRPAVSRARRRAPSPPRVRRPSLLS